MLVADAGASRRPRVPQDGEQLSPSRYGKLGSPTRPATPTLQAPTLDQARRDAVVLLQRLLRGRAIQNEMLQAAAHKAELITELLTPVAVGAFATLKSTKTREAAADLTTVGTWFRKLLQYASGSTLCRRGLASAS